MVTANIPASVDSLGQMFEARDYKGIAITGSLATVGASVALMVGDVLVDAVGSGAFVDRADMALLAVGSFLAALGMTKFFGPAVGGAMTIGALVMLGSGVVLTVLGGPDAAPQQFRRVAPNGSTQTSLGGLSGSLTANNRSLPPAERAGRGEPRDIADAPAVAPGGFR